MRCLSLFEVLELHEAIIASSGGLRGIRDSIEHLNLQSVNLALLSIKTISIQALFQKRRPSVFPSS